MNEQGKQQNHNLNPPEQTEEHDLNEPQHPGATIGVIKVINPLYIGNVGPLIQRYYEKVNVHKLNNVTYETLYTYFSNTVQFGGNMAEFWVAYKNDQPAGFALWRLMGLPYHGTVYCEHFFKAVKDHAVASHLANEFIVFGKKHRAPYYMFCAINEVVGRVLSRLAGEFDLNLIKTGDQTFIGRLKNG